MGDKPAVIAGEPHEGSYLLFGLGPGPVSDRLDLACLGFDASATSCKTQVIGVPEAKATLLGVGGQPCPSQGSQHGGDLLEMGPPLLPMDYYVIQILLVGPEDPVHQPLEGGRGSMEAKREHNIMEQAVGGDEGGLLPGLWRQGYLPVAFGQV